MISRLTRINGVLKVEIDGKIYEPLAFKSFRPSAANISEFAKAGVKLFSILTTGRNCAYQIPYSLYGESWIGRGIYDLDVIDKQIDLFVENAPEGYFALMIQLDTRSWWLDSHENYPDSYGHLSQMAADEEWREEAGNYLQTVVSHVEQKYGERFYGYFLLCGIGTEWLSDFDYQQTHPIKEKYYQDYINDPRAVIPAKEELELDSEISFYDDEKIKLYHKAHAELIADTILYFAGKVQDIIEHRKLVGLYFGYVLELEGERLWNAGHQAYEKIFCSKDINMISSPASYEFRAPDSVSAFMVAHKALDIYDKLYFFEFDQRTYLSQSFLEGKVIPPAGYHCIDDLEAVNLMRRDFMLCCTNGAALWWFDMWNGWYSSEKMLKGITGMIEIAKYISAFPQQSAAEIAVFVSGEAFYQVNKMSGINSKLLCWQREGLARMGAPYDVYSLSDLTQADLSQYKLFIFLTAFETNADQDAMIDRIKQSGKSILWVYAPGFVNGGQEKVMEIIGMELETYDQKPQYSGEGGVVLSAPYFYVSDEEAIPLEKYDDGKLAVAYKNIGNYTAIYSGLGRMSGGLLREIAKLSGVHIYCEAAPVYVNSLLIGVYAQESRDVEIMVKQDGVWEDLFTQKRYVAENRKLVIPGDEYASKMFIHKAEE